MTDSATEALQKWAEIHRPGVAAGAVYKVQLAMRSGHQGSFEELEVIGEQMIESLRSKRSRTGGAQYTLPGSQKDKRVRPRTQKKRR